MIDWGQAAITVGPLVAAFVVKEAFSRGRTSDHEKRLDSHDAEFKSLPDKFITRSEVSSALTDVKDSQKRTNDILDRLLFRMAGLGKEEDK